MSPQLSSYQRERKLQELHQSAANLTRYACMVSSQHIQDGTVRGQFNWDVANYVRQVLSDVRNASRTIDDGIRQIQLWHTELQPHIFASKKVIGLRAGFYQLFDGVKLCRSRASCVVGLPMMAHGANNVYENGVHLWAGNDDATGLVRRLYRYVAEELGNDPIEGDIAYGKADIALSLYSLYRTVPKSDSWKLFRRIPSDFERAHKAMGKGALALDAAATGVTVDQLYEDMKK